MRNSALSVATVTSVALLCKAFLNLGFCRSVVVNGLDHLLEALNDDDARRKGKGIVTVANHISVLDDPVIWGALPTKTYLKSRTTRWALGASDIMFTNPLFSEFFRQGQVWETFRGKGIYQPAVDNAIRNLNNGDWVHLFGEGKINQPKVYEAAAEGKFARLPRFKWGTGRIIMETNVIPTIIPMWLTGFDQVMPEPRGFPKFLPRLRKDLSITFGSPMDPLKLSRVIDPWRERFVSSRDSSGHTSPLTVSGESPLGDGDDDKCQTRSALTDVVQREVEALGYTISGPSLNGKSVYS